MTKVTVSSNCKNDPNRHFIQAFNLAFARCDIDFIADCFTDDAEWEMVGGQKWTGKAAIIETLKTMNDGDAAELVMENIISNGNKCAANGILKYDGGSDVAYCDMYTFTDDSANKKVKALKAYAIEV